MSERGSPDRPLSRTAFELRALVEREPGVCPICRFTRQGIEQDIDGLFYERVNDGPTREAIRRSGGFCRYHARLVEQHGDALGTGIIMRDLLTNDLRAIEDGSYGRRSGAGGTLSRLFDGGSHLPARAPCALCTAECALEELAADSLMEALADRDFAGRFRRSQGLCVPHFRLAFERSTDEDTWQIVLEVERSALRTLIADLDELIRKYDYRFKDEARGEESQSWRTAIDMTSRRVDR